jgi:phosphoglycolate phosphatase
MHNRAHPDAGSCSGGRVAPGVLSCVVLANFDLVIFDLDGTLVDTAPDIAGALNAALALAGVAALPFDVVKQLVGDGGRELIRRALAREGVERDIDRLFGDFLEHYRAHVSDRSAVYDGVPAALAALAAAGMTTAVVTNKPGDIARTLLANLGLADRFRDVVGDGDGFPRKPDPAAARALVDAVGTHPGRTIIVGDGLPDVRCAHALGAKAIAAAWGYVAADRLLAESPDALARTPAEAARLILDGGGPRHR